jgi:hypothetical protein
VARASTATTISSWLLLLPGWCILLQVLPIVLLLLLR